MSEPHGDLRTRNTRPVTASVSTTASALPYGTDSERDRQVGTRLAELAPAAAVRWESWSSWPGRARHAAPGPATVVRQRPGSEGWGAWTRASTAALLPSQALRGRDTEFLLRERNDAHDRPGNA